MMLNKTAVVRDLFNGGNKQLHQNRKMKWNIDQILAPCKSGKFCDESLYKITTKPRQKWKYPILPLQQLHDHENIYDD